MVDSTITALPAGTAPAGTEPLPVDQSGATVKITVAQVANLSGTPNNPVTSAAAARPTGLTVVHWRTLTQPTNWAAGDVWTVA